MSLIFKTKRLIIRTAKATDSDIELYFNLWNDPQVMINVGFPNGLKISKDEIKNQIENHNGTEFNRLLIVETSGERHLIGECKLGLPDEENISVTDVKLLPGFWGNKYGIEIKLGLIEYLFTRTNCKAVKATPNRKNSASIKMQESAGAKRTGEGICRFPEKMKSYTCDVEYYEYMIFREDWTAQRDS